MSFKLVIECSKDIDKLHIDFSDGTSVVTHTEEPKQPKRQSAPSVPSEKTQTTKKKSKREPKEHPRTDIQFLDTDVDFEQVQQDVVELPKIEDVDRTVSVAEELQNLDI